MVGVGAEVVALVVLGMVLEGGGQQDGCRDAGDWKSGRASAARVRLIETRQIQ